MSKLFFYIDGDVNSKGVYKITCKSTGRYYIGATTDSFRKRWCKHLGALRWGKHHNIRLQRAFDKYTEEDFVFSIVEDCKGLSDEVIFNMEESYLLKLDLRKHFNFSRDRQGHVDKPKFSEEECNDIVEFYISNNLNIFEVGKKYGVSETPIKLIISGRYKNSKISTKQLNAVREKGRKTVSSKQLQAAKLKRKLTEKQAGQVKWLSSFLSNNAIGRYFGINSGTVFRILNGKSYKTAPPIECPEILNKLGG